MKFSLSQEEALKAKIKQQKAKRQERADEKLEALIKKEQEATKTRREILSIRFYFVALLAQDMAR